MATVNFYPRSKNGASKIQVRVIIGRTATFLLSTKFSVNNVETDWDFKKKMPRDVRRKKALEAIRAKFLNYITDVELDLTKSVADITSDDFKTIIYDIHNTPEKLRTFKRRNSENFKGYIDSYLERCRKRGYRTKGNELKQYTEATLAKYSQLKATLDLFEKEESIVTQLNSWDSKLCDTFENFLVEHFAVSTAGRKLKALKTILTAAFKEGKQVDPFFNSIKGFSYKPTVVPLSEDEQELIFATPMPTKELEVAKDWLLVLTGTGQRFGDANRFTKDHIKDGAIQIIQKKTGNKAIIPIFDRVQRIIDKYDGFPPKFSDNASSQNVTLNLLVKDVCEIAGIVEMLESVKNGVKGRYPKHELISTKTGRKSLATYLYKEKRWDVQSCMEITGHKAPENFFTYVGGKISAITDENKRRIKEINQETREKRSVNLNIVGDNVS